MKRFSLVATTTLVAMMAWGCGSTDNNAGTPAPTNDTAGAADAADTTGGDAQAKDTVTAADTAAKIDAAAVDTTQVDTTPVDTTPPSQKCTPSGNAQADSMCVQNCATKACSDQVATCSQDINCGKVTGCINDCGKKPPVELPGAATHTCAQKCYTTFGDDATTKFIAHTLCWQSQCYKAAYSLPCGQTNPQCQNNCAMDLCDKEILECINEPGCLYFFSCASSKCTDTATQQACAGTCAAEIVEKFGQAGAQKAQLAQTAVSLCTQNKCP